MTAVTRTKLDRCATTDCPARDDKDWHDEWMERCAKGAEHGHRHDKPTHAHFPKKGMGGNNPNAKIVAHICWPLHDMVDNGLGGMGIALGEVRFWDLHNRTILRGPAPSSEGEVSEEGSPLSPAASPSVPGGEPTAEGEGSPVGELLDSGVQPRYSPSAAGSRPSDEGERENAAVRRPPSSVQPRAESGFSPSSPGLVPDVDPPRDAGRRDSRGASQVLHSFIPSSSGAKPQPRAVTPAPSISELDWESWCNRGKIVRHAIHATPWAFGDWANVGEDYFGEKAWDEIGVGFDRRDYQKLRNWMWVAKSIPPAERFENLSWSHHRAAAHLPSPERDRLLRRAAREGWTRDQLADAMPATTVAIVKPARPKQYSTDELREAAESFSATDVRNNGPKYLAAFLEHLEKVSE